jgi:hypothetical protein
VKKHILMLALFAVLCCTGATSAFAQTEYPDSKGRDFWFVFPPNFHNNHDSLFIKPLEQLEHQLYIYIGSDSATTGTITLVDKFGQPRIVPFTITDPTKLFEYRTFFGDFELTGFNRGGVLDFAANQCETTAPQHVHIEADRDVNVYALHQGDLTSDAFLVLPTDALGEDYVVMAYNSDTRFQTFGGLAGASTPSQFVVVAVEDNTSVEVQPSAPTVRNPGMARQVITLNKGQSYLVQADPRTSPNSDLTGSLVRATKPVAVFGGHQRALVPREFVDQLQSRDCLIEQMNPVRTWGKSAFLTPYPRSSNEVLIGYDLYRVLAGFDSTVVDINGTVVATINAGQVYEGRLDQAMVVETSRPAMIAQIRKTSSGAGQAGNRIGDPFMMLIPPKEQFLEKYRFINAQSYAFDGDPGNPQVIDTIYREQYVTVVVPTVAVSSVRLDGQPLNGISFQRIGSSDHSFGIVSPGDGVHEITANTFFGIYVYGYGNANSYGYIGGMSFRPLDVYPPVITAEDTCGVVNGVMTDSVLGDTRITVAEVVSGTENNVTATIDPFNAPATMVTFKAALLDKYLDGSFQVQATDFVLQTTTARYDVPGYTLSVKGRRNNPQPEPWRMSLPVDRNRCDSLTITNYGRFPQTVRTLGFAGGTPATFSPMPPFTVGPNDSVVVTYCAIFDTALVFADTIEIADTCAPRPIREIVFDVRDDEDAPRVTEEYDSCSSSRIVSVVEDLDTDFGLESVAVLDSVLVNCTIVPIDATATAARYTLTILDPYQDAIYGFRATDSAGNVSVVIDTIPGFTLSITDETQSSGTVIEYDTIALGVVECRDLTFTNYGLFPIDIPTLYLHVNVRFSAPQHQFPFTLQPGESRALQVCFQPTEAPMEYWDTLTIGRECVERARVLHGFGGRVLYESVSRCDVPLDLNVRSILKAPVIVPLPASDDMTIVLPRESSELTMRLYALTGGQAGEWTYRGPVTQAVRISVAEIPAGLYGLVLTTPQGALPVILTPIQR